MRIRSGKKFLNTGGKYSGATRTAVATIVSARGGAIRFTLTTQPGVLYLRRYEFERQFTPFEEEENG